MQTRTDSYFLGNSRFAIRPLAAGWILIILLIGFLLTPCPVMAGGGPAEMASGIAWFDCDGDGDLDILYLTPEGEIILMVYDVARDRFTNTSNEAFEQEFQRLAKTPQGVSCGDFNNDGHEDFFLAMEGPNHIFINNGGGTFRATTAASSIEGKALSASTAVFDYNNDGLLDIYVTNYMGMPNQLFRNDGFGVDGTPHFTNVAPELGVDLAPNGESNWSLGVAVADYDNDGDVDLYVANDFNGYNEFGGLNPGENILYRNEGDGTFEDVSYWAGAADPGWAMGVDFGDYDNDGWLDIFIANFWEDALLHNNGDGTFSDVTRETGLITGQPDEWFYNSWGTSFIDYDNDGDMDLHVSNGWITNGKGQVINEPNQLWENTGVGTNGHVRFVDISEESGIADVGNARGASYGDFNRDGLMDILVSNNQWVEGGGIVDSPYRLLYVNQGDGTFQDKTFSYGLRVEHYDGPKLQGGKDLTGNRWIQVGLEGRQSNRSGIGSRVTVKAGGKTWIEDMGACSYASQNSPYIHFGLGAVDVIDELVVRFPSGRTLSLENLAPDQILTLTEPQGVPVRLLSFDVAPAPGGTRITWTFVDEGDLIGFTLRRRMEGSTTLLASVPVSLETRMEVLDTGVPAGAEAVYKLGALYRDGSSEVLGTRSFRHLLPAAVRIEQNVPNPFRYGTAFPVIAARSMELTIGIFDTAGRRVAGLERTVPAGRTLFEWDGLDHRGHRVPVGTYFYRVLETGESGVMKMTVVR